MRRKFRLFVRKHDNGTYTVTVPGIARIPEPDDWEDIQPAASSLAAHSLVLEEAKDDLRTALEKWLCRVDAAELHRFDNHREGQRLEKVEIELRPTARDPQAGTPRKRRDKVRLKVSLLVNPEEEGQQLVSVPKLSDRPLAFYRHAGDDLQEIATQELAAYFRDHSFEQLLEYQHQRQETLDELEVGFTPLKPQRERKQKEDEEETSHFWALRSAAVNLTARVREGKLLRAYRRDREIETLLGILDAERNNSILLVGPSGAGKTALVHELVRRIHEERCPASLSKRQVWSTSPSQLIAGCSFLGEWEEKLQNIIDEVKKRRQILLVDDVAGLLEVGRHSKGDENMAQFLKPFLVDGTVVLIGESLPERHRVAENHDPGFLRLFRTVRLEETEEETTLSILGLVAAALEREFRVRIEPSACEAAVELTRRFQPYRAFPGKAVAFLESLAADTAKAATARGDAEERPVISRQGAVSGFARQTGLPEFLLSDHLTMEPAGVQRHFSERLIGQPDAVARMVDLVTVIKAGLNDPQKPLGCFFFVGPTGVGKTEMAKTLAEYLFGSRDRLLRFDMSEYAEPLNVARLIGSAHGGDEGELTKRIRLQPFSVVLLDEFEKANAAIFDVMLQVLGEGRLTDAAGRTADFRSAIILMTSNLGASPREQRQPGLRQESGVRSLAEHFRKQVEAFFRPEFVNRLDRIVVFNALDREAMRGIAAREVRSLLEREGITRRRLLVEIEDEVLDLLLETGFSPVYGARPLKREIERRIIVPLARYLVAHRVAGSQLIRIGRAGDEVELASATLTAARQRVQRAGPLPAAPAAGRSLTLKELIDAFAAVRLRLHDWSAGDAVREIENEWKQALASTRKRGFSKNARAAGKVWARIYHLERLTKRLGQLRERAEYLEEFAALSQRERHGRYEPDLAQSYTELCRDSDYLEIELLTAHMKESGQALLRLEPVGRVARAGVTGEAWLLTLAKMYLRWAKRKGYHFVVYAPTDPYRRWLESQCLSARAAIPGFEPGPPVRPPWTELRGGDFPALLKRLEALEPPSLALSIQGVNAYGFLKGEDGAHKLLIRPDEYDPAAPFQTTAVHVEALEETASAEERLLELWEEAEKARQERAATRAKRASKDAPEIVRLYMPDGDRHVRDLRTDLRTTRVKEVLEGDLDEFILAYLRTEEAVEAWNAA